MNKFNKTDHGKEAATWGDVYTGDSAPEQSPAERYMRERILLGSLGEKRAADVRDHMDCNSPFYSAFDFVEALASLAALYKGELSRKTHVKGATIACILWRAADPGKIQWYMNNIRLRRGMPKERLSLLGSGTSPNESLHAEINRWFRNQPEMYINTLAIQLDINGLGKLLAHNGSLYSPQLRQNQQRIVLAAVVANFKLDIARWDGWCDALKDCTGRVTKAHLPNRAERVDTKRRLKDHAMRRPAAFKTKVSKKKAHVKRTPFTLKRSVPMLRIQRPRVGQRLVR